MRDSARLKAKPNCVGCEAGQLHQHLPGYEPDALLLSYRPVKMVGYPGAAPGVSWSQTKRERLALSYPMKRWTCTPDLHWVMRFCGPLTRLFVLRTK